LKTCKRCILNDEIPTVTLDRNGVCNYCKLHHEWETTYVADGLSRYKTDGLTRLIKQIQRERKKNSRYDCIVGISGGCDSSYLLMLVKDHGLNPLAVHWNNGWNTEIAENNVIKVVKRLGVDLCIVGMNQIEYDDICHSFLLASVPDADIPNDIALTTVLYMAAEAFNVTNILDGHSYRTEGTCPIGWSYMDARYIQSVQEKYGSIPLETFPNLWLPKWVRWLNMGIKRPRLLWYLNYDKKEAQRVLRQRFKWQWYGGHHCENKYSMFVGNYLQPQKFGIDLRYIEYSALIRSGQMSQRTALDIITDPPEIDEWVIEEVKERLRLGIGDLETIMAMPIKTHLDYDTYRAEFKRLEPLFSKLVRDKAIPNTFYQKYVLSS